MFETLKMYNYKYALTKLFFFKKKARFSYTNRIVVRLVCDD